MKLSEAWLREWVNPAIDLDELVAKVTMAGLEVDAVEPVAGDFSHVVVGEIVSIEQHPDADKLRVCQVRGAPEGKRQVVCGAPNARVGIKVPFALVGAKLPGGLEIKQAKLRGVESSGMLCGQDELHAGDDKSGLWELPLDAPVGQDLRDFLKLGDHVIEIDLTPNRSDCLSIAGIAREVAVLTDSSLSIPDINSSPPAHDEKIDVILDAGEACPRYVGRVINNVDVSKTTPLWMQEKLRRCGVRPIDPVVDVTNYVLLELGQPMHAFDKAKLNGNICVRFAQSHEKLLLLNDQEVELNDNTLVIADEAGPVAMAGIMGGAQSAVSGDTKDIFLEAAFFSPVAIAGKARSYGLHTDSSHRFERGVDYNLPQKAIERASELLLEIVGGDLGPVSEVVIPEALPSIKKVTLKKSRLNSILGFEFDASLIESILTRLGLNLISSNDSEWVFDVPSYRFDIAIDADLIEEIARIYGYDRLPTNISKSAIDLSVQSENKLVKTSLVRHLTSRGFNEVIVYSFIDPDWHQLFYGDEPAVVLKNPISRELGTMRRSIVPGLVHTLKTNLNRQNDRIRIFETGLTFSPSANAGYLQQKSIAALIYGPQCSQNWCETKSEIDFYDLKGEVEALFELTGNAAQFKFVKPSRPPAFLHPGQTAEIKLADENLGYLGALHPLLVKKLSLTKIPFVFEMQLDKLLRATKAPLYTPISKFPSVTRDLAILIDREIEFAEVEQVVRDASGQNLKSVAVFDQYMGQGIPDSKKSVAFNLTFQDNSRTLNDDEILEAMNAIISRLEQQFEAKLR